MYAAKHGNGGQVRAFDPGMHQAATARLLLEQDVRRGLDAAEFVPYYQPIVDAVTGQVLAVEALARWQHPTRGILAAGAFLPAVDQSGLTAEFGQRMLTAACADIAE